MIAASVQELSWKTERKRTRLGQSERNGCLAFFSFLFGGNKKKPNVLFWVNPNCIFNVMFCFEVSYPSLLTLSFISGLF